MNASAVDSIDTVTVVGIGADGLSGLAPAAMAAVAQAQVLFGSARQLALVPAAAGDPGVQRVSWPSPLLPALLGLMNEHKGKRRCVLASGDPMYFGIGPILSAQLGRLGTTVRVLPQVSAVSLACARLGWALQSTEVISVVGRPVAGVLSAAAPGRRLLVLSADEQSPVHVARLLTDAGFGDSELIVLEELGGPQERIVRGTAAKWESDVAALNVLAIECRGVPGRSVGFGLPDDIFDHDGQLTKRDVRAVTMARLAPAHGELLWDVGAGSGSIAIEWLRAAPSCTAVAVEADPVRADRIGRNAIALGVPHLRVVAGSAPAALDGLPAPDVIFIGGGLTATGVLPACWQSLKPGGRLVANAVTVESEALLLASFAEFGGELIRIGISQAAPIGGFTGWRPAMPVTQWSVSRPMAGSGR